MSRPRRAAALCLALAACQTGQAPSVAPHPVTRPEPDPSPLKAPSIRITVQTGIVTSARLRHRLTLASSLGELAWSPDAARLAVGDDDGDLKIWDARTGQVALELGKHDRRISALAYAPGGDLIAAAGLTDLRVWDAVTGALVHKLPGHGDIINDLRFVGDELYAVDLRNALRRWDPRGGRELAVLDVPTIHMLSMAIAPGGAALAMGGYGDLELLALPARTSRFKLKMPRCDQAANDLLCAAWKTRQVEEFGHEDSPPATYKENSPQWYVQDLAFSADGTRLLFGRADGVAVLLETTSGEPLARFTVGDDDHAWVALTPDGATAALANHDGLIALFDVATRERLVVVHEPHQIVSGLAFAPDASALAAAGPGPAVTIWDLVR